MANRTAVAKFRIDRQLDADSRNAAARLGVTTSELHRAALRRYVDELTAEDVLADPEIGPKVEASRVQQRAAELLELV